MYESNKTDRSEFNANFHFNRKPKESGHDTYLAKLRKQKEWRAKNEGNKKWAI